MKSLILILAFFSASAFAQTKQDGNAFLKEITGNDMVQMYALGYVFGMSELIPCISGEITNGQLVDVVKKYLEQNPETRHLHRSTLVFRALSGAFPCKQEPTPKPKKPV
jgi:hypothetical protein